MPSTSPGHASSRPPTDFVQVLPGAPTPSLQALATLIFRHKHYVVYISGSQLNICVSPTKVVQVLNFDDDLVAVAAESQTAKITVAGRSDVYVLEAIAEGWAKVWWEKSLCLLREDAGDEAQCLSWGSEGELSVGGSRQLSLFSTLPSSRTSSPAASPVDGEDVEKRKALWSKPVASPVQYAAFSPSANLIATCGKHDRLVKIWRRLSFEEGLFDYTYLPHPGAVTHVEWRPLDEHSQERRGSGISGRHEENPEVLYTIANDGVLRIWRTCGMHDLEIVILHATLDLVAAIPQSPNLTRNGASTPPKPARFAFVIPADNFEAAVTAAATRSGKGKPSHALEHLKEMSSKSPDVIVTLDGHGRMSAWGLQSIGHKRRPETPGSKQAFHIAHAEGLPFELTVAVNARFQTWFGDSTFHLLAQSFDRHVRWWQGDVDAFFSPSAAGRERLMGSADWSGHTHQLAGMNAAEDRTNLVSWTASGEVVLWKQVAVNALEQVSGFDAKEKTLVASTCGLGKIVATLHPKDVAIRDAHGNELARAAHSMRGRERLRLRTTPDGQGLLVYSAEGDVLCATIKLNRRGSDTEDTYAIEIVDRFTLASVLEAVTKTMRVTCAGAYQAGAMLVSVDSTGLLACTTLFSTPKSDLGIGKTLSTALLTGVTDTSILEANEEVAAMVSSSGKEVVVVDLKEGYIEHRQVFTKVVHDLRCYRTPDGHNFLAVAFDTSVEILAQGHYDHHQGLDTWTTVKRASVAGTGLRITTLEWVAGTNLAIGVGNGLMLCGGATIGQQLEDEVQDRLDLRSNAAAEIALSELASNLNRHIVAWHPSALSHLVDHGKPAAAIGLLRRLNEKLKFWSEGDELHPLLDDPTEELVGDRRDHQLSDEAVRELAQQLDEKNLPATSNSEQQGLKLVVQALAFVCEHINGLDMCALRYLYRWKLQLLHMPEADQTPNGAQPNGATRLEKSLVPQMHWREIAFASHSTTQQPLLDILALHYDNKITWDIARSLGVTAWLSDKEALEQAFESLAQSAYRQTSSPDPINASLFFLALHKKQTLLGLWRIATWHKEQRATTNFLKRDFSQPECKTAAKKNAYALMGKRRFEYAAAFFLLADDAASAVSLLAGQCEDAMLAIAVARLYGGDGSVVLRRLLEERLMPVARREGDRWLMSWCHSALREKQEAAEALVQPISGVRTWQQDDPSTMVLYQQLRQVLSEHEYTAVLRAARVLRRMGMWLLALDLVSTWTFMSASPPTDAKPDAHATSNGFHHEPPSMLDDFAKAGEPIARPDEAQSTPPRAMDEKAAREAKAAELLAKLKAKKGQQSVASAKPPPTQFKEPDASSLLDSFGF